MTVFKLSDENYNPQDTQKTRNWTILATMYWKPSLV